MRGSRGQERLEGVPEIDYNEGCRYFLGNMENYYQALLAILKSIKSKLPIIQSMMITQEYEGLRSIVRFLQKMLTNIGANSLVEDSYQLERSLLNGEIGLEPKLLEDYTEKLITFSMHLEQMFQKVEIRKIMDKETDSPAFFRQDFTKTKECIKRTSDLLDRRIIS
jgi:HPt (histidine-containing phosphotransfer) domain-containing protein